MGTAGEGFTRNNSFASAALVKIHLAELDHMKGSGIL